MNAASFCRGRVRGALVLALAAAAPLAQPALGQRMGRWTLDPKTYTSSSGEFALQVDPSTIYGQGEGSYVFTRGGKPAWEKKLPFTLWDAQVTDDGVIAGYAYSGGQENYVPEGEEGRLHMVVLDADGALRMNEVLPRRGVFSCTSTVDRNVTGFMVDPENDRFIVRCREGGWASSTEAWRVFRLSTGALIDEFEFAHPKEGARENWFVLATQPVKGTPLVLVSWKYNKWDETGNQLQGSGGRFALIDPGGGMVWEHDVPGGYPEPYASGLDGERDAAEIKRLRMLAQEINRNGAILPCAAPRQFKLWLVREGQCVTFGVEKTDAGAWKVAERAREPRAIAAPAEPSDQADALPALTLKHVGTIKLEADAAAAPEIRDIEYFDLDPSGRIGFLRAEPDRSITFVLADGERGVIRTLSLKELLGENYMLPKIASVGADQWVLIAATWQVTAEGERSEPRTHAWWLSSDTGKLEPIEPFTGQGARRIAAVAGGGFAVTIDPPLGSGQAEAVAVFDPGGKERWRRRAAPDGGISYGTSGVTVTSDGAVVVEQQYGEDLAFFNGDGTFVRTTSCADLFGKDSSGAGSVSADLDGGLLVTLHYPAGQVYRVARDGSIRARFKVAHPDGRSVELVGFPDQVGVRVAQDGTLWACDGHTLLRLDESGVVRQILGEAPDAPVLRRIAAAAVDQGGNIYLTEQRNGITHVFDANGKPVRLLRPDPADFDDADGQGLDVAGDGAVYVGLVKFSPTGERVGLRALPTGVEAPDSFFGRVRSHPHGPQFWVISNERATLVGDGDRVLRKIERRPDGNWLDRVEASAVGPHGELALASESTNVESGDRKAISVYGPDGEPRVTSMLPDFEESWPRWESIAFSGRYVLTGPWGHEHPRYLLLDTAAEPPKWYDLGRVAPFEDRWHYFFTKDGDELWMLAERARKVERFEIPDRQPRSAAVPPSLGRVQP